MIRPEHDEHWLGFGGFTLEKTEGVWECRRFVIDACWASSWSRFWFLAVLKSWWNTSMLVWFPWSAWGDDPGGLPWWR